MADERIYGTLGGYGQQSGEYGDPLNPRTMTVYTGNRRLAPTQEEIAADFERRFMAEAEADDLAEREAAADLERRLMAEATDIEFAEAEDALLAPSEPLRPELARYGNTQAPPVVSDPAAMRQAGKLAMRHMGADREAIMAEQRALGVTVDGIVGPETLRARARARQAAMMDPQVEAGLARARAVLASAPDGVTMPPMRVTARPPQTMVMPEERITATAPRPEADNAFGRVRELVRRGPELARPAAPLTVEELQGMQRQRRLGLSPESMLESRNAERRAQMYAEAIAGQQRAQVEQQEQAAARRTADERAAELSTALEQAGADFIDRLQRGEVDTSGYTESMRQAPPITLDEEQRTQSLIEGLGQAGALTDAQLSRGAIDATMDGVRPRQFEYRAQTGLDTRPRAGILAQDLERTPLGRSIVRETPRGKALDVGQLSGANAAMIGRLNERLRKLEAK